MQSLYDLRIIRINNFHPPIPYSRSCLISNQFYFCASHEIRDEVEERGRGLNGWSPLGGDERCELERDRYTLV